jgi:hypothetical protein
MQISEAYSGERCERIVKNDNGSLLTCHLIQSKVANEIVADAIIVQIIFHSIDIGCEI